MHAHTVLVAMQVYYKPGHLGTPFSKAGQVGQVGNTTAHSEHNGKLLLVHVHRTSRNEIFVYILYLIGPKPTRHPHVTLLLTVGRCEQRCKRNALRRA